MSRVVKFRFRHYVAGDAQNSVQAFANLTAICRTHLANRHEIALVDVYKEPMRALEDRIFRTPTFVKRVPGPAQRIIGTLTQAQSVLQSLGLGDFPE